ncbi:hypothetical protein SPRG_05137 [Saprolegnia parasitica CBS 223.65]|uniref:MSP domain-containing protein n=1 Tax=Saprolegnia parasitica (strain CBS 223.65) TaxID=695850 RepID=A0A067CT23_SAPPC|nr:hypothetical protein SPRG_05137 [Saprolegnia parasitica CBS 223.65]KDO29947.1 hypothetical protein SPRG_05137 [Saprolegnia parasitica CBS 223.65]|eukprot:XP_012199131.1 hypothetical protein SPRG_05137 [Saprolegnia parasitica CBS 223.65]
MGSAQGRPTAVRSSSPRRASVLAPTAFDQHAVVDPSDVLSFTLIPNTSPVVLLTLHNVGAEMLTFAVQTKATHAHRFFADPPRGIVGPGKCATIVVGLKQG